MYGNNKVAKIDQRSDGRLKVNSIWQTIQGEGPDAGRPAIFIRLSGCNLRCWFCDTEFDRGINMTVAQVMKRVSHFLESVNRIQLVVITGGEPLLQNILPLVDGLNQVGLAVSIETAGTVDITGLDKRFGRNRPLSGNSIVCSPKTPLINQRLVPLVSYWKYLIRSGEVDETDGLPIVSTQIKGERAKIYRPPYLDYYFSEIYVQPVDEDDDARNKANVAACLTSCRTYGYRLSLQIHKSVGLP